MRFCRWSMLGLLVGSLYLVGGCLRATQAAAGDAPYQPGTPFTYLFDTGSQSPRPLSARSLGAKAGWTLVPEDNTEHAFQGDAVLLNDRLVVVVRAKGLGAEVCSQTTGGLKSRAVVMAAPVRAVSGTGIRSVRVVENNPGAVTVEATFETDAAGPCSARFRLTTGQAILEMVPGEAADRLFVWCTPRYVVVPDFFGDDMVFSAAHCDLPRFGLPAENFFISLVDGGDAMLMCVWRSGRQQAYAIPAGEGPQRVIRGCEIEGGADNMLWVGFLEGPNIWHEQTVAAEPAQEGVAVDWKPPFAARWRCDLVWPDGLAQSHDLADWERSDQGTAGSVPNQPRGPGWSEAIRATPEASQAVPLESLPMVLYPLDRSRDTPLTAFCPVDVLRNTLGVGPCQYILETEGLASETNPTPDTVASWVESQFKRNKSKEAAEEMEELLGQMVEHVGHAQARIRQYADLAREVDGLWEAERQKPDVSETVHTLSGIVGRIRQTVATGQGATEPSDRAAQLAGRIVDLIGKDDALAECQRLGAELRRLGADQDRALSKCRMAVRWLRQQARMCALRDPASAELAREIEARAEQFLQSK